MEKGKGEETTANPLFQEVRLGAKEAKGDTSVDGSSMQVSRKGNHIKRIRSIEVPTSYSKRPKNRRTWELALPFNWLSSSGQI